MMTRTDSSNVSGPQPPFMKGEVPMHLKSTDHRPGNRSRHKCSPPPPPPPPIFSGPQRSRGDDSRHRNPGPGGRRARHASPRCRRRSVTRCCRASRRATWTCPTTTPPPDASRSADRPRAPSGPPSDQDRFAVGLEAGRTYRFDLTGRPGGGGTLPDTYFRAIYDSEGRYQSGSYNDDFDGGRDSRVTFTPTQSGTYYARVSGDRNETGTYTLSVTDVTPELEDEGQKPAKPRGLTAEATHGQVVLTWDDPGDDSITGYVVLRRVRVNDTGGDFDVLVANTETAALTYTDDTVAAGLTYTYRIKAINEHGVSERSRWVHIDTPAAPAPEEEQAAEPPDQPTGLSAAATHDSVTLTWDDPGDDSITGYVVLRRVRVNDTGGDFDVLVANTETAATTYTDATVAASTTYTYRIKAINAHGTSARSRWSHINTPPAPEAAEGDEQDGEGDGGGGAPGGSGTKANVSEGTDLPHDTATTGEMDVGGSVMGNIDPVFDTSTRRQGRFMSTIDASGDEDWIGATLEAGKRYQIDLEGVDTGRGTLEDPYLAIFDPEGDEIPDTDDDNSGVGNNARVIYTPTADGKHFVSASAGSGGMTDTGTYTLSVIVLGANGKSEADVDFPDNNTTTGRVEVGVTGNLMPSSDIDWFSVMLELGRTYVFDLEGSETSSGTLANPYLSIRNQAGTTQYSSDDDSGKGLNSRFAFTAIYGGIHYLVASAASSASSGGTYRLWVRDITLPEDGFWESNADLPTNTTTSGGVMVDGDGARGTIAPPVFVDNNRPGYDFDTDWFRVVLVAGRTYRIDMKGQILSSPGLDIPGEPVDAELTLSLPQINAIYDADGDFLVNTRSRDESSSHHLFRVTFHAHADGTHYIAASGESFEWGGYELRVIDITPASKPAVADGPPGLAPNVPNPFNPSTVIPYRLATPGAVRLEIYNLLGQHVRTLVDEAQTAGSYRVHWDARDGRGAAVATGVYFIRLRYPGGVQTRRMLYLE